MKMLKFITPLCFVIAAVAGDWPPQDYGQNQVHFPLQPPQSQIESGPVLLPQSGLPVGMPRARPCRRRNFGSSGVSPDSGWAPVPITQQQFGSQLVPPQLKPQSLTENRAPDTDDNNKAVKSPRNTESLHNSNKKNSNPTYLSENHNIDENESKRDTQDPLESDKNNQNSSPHEHIEDEHYHHHHHHTNDGREDPYEQSHHSHECDMHEDGNEHEKHDESDHHSDDTSKAAPTDVHEEAVKLISKCVEEAKAENTQDDIQGESRRSNSPSEAKNREVVISPKSKPINISDRDEDSTLSTSKVKPSSALDRLDPQVYNPAKDAGKYQSNPKVSLLQNGRVCYACSTYFDSSCWKPNGTTTVKYCYKNNNACVTRTFKVGDKTILTRDCGHTCNEDNPYGVGPKHTSCSMCHTDMCNSAYSINALNVLLVTFVISAITFTLQ